MSKLMFVILFLSVNAFAARVPSYQYLKIDRGDKRPNYSVCMHSGNDTPMISVKAAVGEKSACPDAQVCLITAQCYGLPDDFKGDKSAVDTYRERSGSKQMSFALVAACSKASCMNKDTIDFISCLNAMTKSNPSEIWKGHPQYNPQYSTPDFVKKAQ